MPCGWLTTGEVAAVLRVHPKQVYRLFARGLPHHRVGGTWRFDADEVRRWAAGELAVGPPPAPTATPPLVGCAGDAAVEVLLRATARADGPLLGTVDADRETALAHLRAGRVLAAGWHGATPPPSRPGEPSLVRLHLVRREVGLVARGPVPALGGVTGARLASRPSSAGVRRVLDEALAAAGLDPAAVHVGARLEATHREVVEVVARGDADVGVATHAWARRLGLCFAPLAAEDYGLLLLASDLGRPAATRLCEAAQSAAVRAALAGEAGYDVAATGAVRFDLGPAAA